jgi:hypothetical protein
MTGGRPRLGPEREAVICRMYLAGEKVEVIRATVGCNRLTVRTVLERNEVPRRRIGRPRSDALRAASGGRETAAGAVVAAEPMPAKVGFRTEKCK